VRQKLLQLPGQKRLLKIHYELLICSLVDLPQPLHSRVLVCNEAPKKKEQREFGLNSQIIGAHDQSRIPAVSICKISPIISYDIRNGGHYTWETFTQTIFQHPRVIDLLAHACASLRSLDNAIDGEWRVEQPEQ
jgi:hypothetical protein